MILFTRAQIVTGASSEQGALAIDNRRICGIGYGENAVEKACSGPLPEGTEVIDLQGKVLMAGGIDAHVHFREPGMMQKADMASESRAALLGGITSCIDMPNTLPPTTTAEALQDKLERARGRFWTDYGFHIGATADNTASLAGIPGAAGIKVFMGSSTGNLLVDRPEVLETLFGINGREILVHSEDERTIRENLEKALEQFGEDIPIRFHSSIRSRRACLVSTIAALEMAIAKGTRLHLLHVSTKEEAEMIRAAKNHNPGITAETSANYLWFCEDDYDRLGSRLKCNPAVKTAADREALLEAVASGVIDTIGSDHAPHLPAEKARPYRTCPSGMPTIQESFSAMLTLAARTDLPLTRIAALMSENAGRIFGLQNKGKLAPGYDADLVIIDPKAEWTVGKPAYKCGWTPYEGMTFTGQILQVWLRGEKVVENGETLSASPSGQPLAYKPIG